MSSRAARPRPRRRLVGVSAVAVGALLTTYAGALRSVTYARAVTPAAASCSPGATLVADDTELQAAVASSVNGSVICVTADITLTATLAIDDTTVTIEGRDVGGRNPVLSGENSGRVIYADFTDNASDDTLTIRDLGLVKGRAPGPSGQGGALYIRGGDRSDALVIVDSEIAENDSPSDGGGVLAENLASVYVGNSLFRNNSIDDTTAGDIAGGALKVKDTGQTTITGSDFRDNSSLEWGGAVFLNDSGVTRIIGSTFERNSSGTNAGGAIEVDIDDSTLPGALYVSSTVFKDNSSTSGTGGAVRVTDNDDTVSFSSVTFDGNSADSSSGGGLNVSSQSGPVFLSDVTAIDNFAGASGGFLRLSGTTPTLFIERLNSQRNSANSDGGSIKQTAGSLSVSNATFLDDSAGVDGGSIYARVEGPLSITDTTATGTTTGDDGGFAYLRSDDTAVVSADFTLSDIQVVDASTTRPSEADGGGFYVGFAKSLQLSNVSVTGSSAADDGGGMFVRQIAAVYLYESTFEGNAAGDESGGVDITSVYSDLIVDSCTFSGNSAADFAGGVYARFAADTQASITNSTFAGNAVSPSGSHGGGGLYLFGAVGTSPTVDMNFISVIGNSAKEGGGIQLGGTVAATIENSIVAGNSALATGADVLLGNTATLDDSFSLFTSANAVSGATIDGPGSIFGAPKLNGLADNGGPTLTMLPQWDSPAFQAGDPNWTAPPANDQRGTGFPRDAGGRVSMGAIQGRSAQPPSPVFPPSAPREVEAVAGDRQAVVSWTAPESTGSFPITTYQVVDRSGGVSRLVPVESGGPLSVVIDELVNGESYAFRVRALNGGGWGAWSEYSNAVIPRPGASILITGSREGRFARVVGATTDLVGQALVPRVRFPGSQSYADGRVRPVVDAQGAFTWQRRTNKKTYVYFMTDDGALRSDRVVIRSRR